MSRTYNDGVLYLCMSFVDTMHQFIFDENPMNPNNTVNMNISGVNRSNIYTLDAGNAMLIAQMRMVGGE